MSEPSTPESRSGGIRSLLAGGLRELYVRPKGNLAGLDALRSAAILLVIGTHWAIPEYELAGGVHTAVQGWSLFSYGWAGVDLFFVLSGYLIGRQLWKELQRTGSVQIGQFLMRRGLRIWPLYFAMLLYYSVYSGHLHPRLSDWTFLSNYMQAGMPRTWSLSTEEQFYIAVPLLILLLRRRIPLARYAWVLLAVEAILLVVRKATLTSFLAGGGDLAKSDYVLVYPFHTHLEGLLAGLLIALLSVTHPKVLERRSATGVFWLGLVVMAASLTVAFTLHALERRLFSFAALGLIFGGVTFWVLGDRSWMTRPLGAWLFYPISRLSYGMYLNHWWVAPSSNKAMIDLVRHVTTDPTTVFLVTLVIGTLVSIAFAAVTFVLIEHPFLVLRDRWLTNRKAKVARATSQVAFSDPTGSNGEYRWSDLS